MYAGSEFPVILAWGQVAYTAMRKEQSYNNVQTFGPAESEDRVQGSYCFWIVRVDLPEQIEPERRTPNPCINFGQNLWLTTEPCLCGKSLSNPMEAGQRKKTKYTENWTEIWLVAWETKFVVYIQRSHCLLNKNIITLWKNKYDPFSRKKTINGHQIWDGSSVRISR